MSPPCTYSHIDSRNHWKLLSLCTSVFELYVDDLAILGLFDHWDGAKLENTTICIKVYWMKGNLIWKSLIVKSIENASFDTIGLKI